MPQDDPPREAVEALWSIVYVDRAPALRDWIVRGLRALRTIPAAARWSLIAWLAEGLEVTEAMLSAVCREAGCDEDSFSAGMVTMTAARNLRAMLAAAARAEEARDG